VLSLSEWQALLVPAVVLLACCRATIRPSARPKAILSGKSSDCLLGFAAVCYDLPNENCVSCLLCFWQLKRALPKCRPRFAVRSSAFCRLCGTRTISAHGSRYCTKIIAQLCGPLPKPAGRQTFFLGFCLNLRRGRRRWPPIRTNAIWVPYLKRE
jgi:hypothetical protein